MEGKYPDLPLRFSWSLSSGKFLLPLLLFNFFPLWFVVWVCSVPKEALLLGCWCCWEVWEYLRGGHSWRKQAAGALPLKGMSEMGVSLCFHVCLPFPPLSFTPSSSSSPLIQWGEQLCSISSVHTAGTVPDGVCLWLLFLSEREMKCHFLAARFFFFLLCCGRNQFYGLS